MSLINDITNAVGFRSTYGSTGQQPTLAAGQQPGEPSMGERLRTRFGGTVATEFQSNLSSVLSRGSNGEWEDPTLALEEQAAIQRLRMAQLEQPVTGGGGSTRPSDPVDATPRGSNAAPTVNEVAVAEQRNVYSIRVRQSEARLKNISSSLAADFPSATQLSSASTGAWDPATFVPRTHDEAVAFAHRLVVDATEGAARLEIIQTQLDAATFEYEQTGSADAKREIDRLTPALARQNAYVGKLAQIVDQQTGGQVTDAGTDAMSGSTMRTASDLPVAEIAASLREDGKSEAEIKQIVGAMELAVEQQKTPGGSKRLKSMAAMITAVQAMTHQLRESSEAARERYRADDAKYEERRLEQKQVDQRRDQRVASEQTAAQTKSRRDAEFQRWIASLAQRSA